MKVIIDTSPLISFAVLDQLDLVDKLFTEIIIPSAVSREIRMSKNKKEYNRISNFIMNRICYPQNKQRLKFQLGDGETEAIILCLEMNADLLIIDDKKARNIAESYKIRCIGTLGLLTLAKKRGLIKEIRKYFIQLIDNERYFSRKLLNEILELNREDPLE